jgi:hypothetical protein
MWQHRYGQECQYSMYQTRKQVNKSNGKFEKRLDIQCVPSKSEQLRLNITFLWSHDFQKFNFKITARALPAIPPKFTGVPIIQPEKKILM